MSQLHVRDLRSASPAVILVMLWVASLVAVSGCATYGSLIGGWPKAKVTIPNPDPDAAPVVYDVMASGGSGPTADGVVDLGVEEYERALANFDKAIQATPDDANALFLCGLAAERVGQLEKAKDCYDRAHKLSHKNAAYRESFLRVKGKLGG